MQAIMTFSGNKWDMTVRDTVAGSGTFTVNSSVVPMTMDMLIEVGGPREKGQTQLGIFEVKDGVLRMHLSEPGVTSRPADFTAPASRQTALLVLKKK